MRFQQIDTTIHIFTEKTKSKIVKCIYDEIFVPDEWDNIFEKLVSAFDLIYIINNLIWCFYSNINFTDIHG